MSGLNRVQLIGHLGADPELKFTQGGQAVLKLRLATTEKIKKGDEWQDITEWHTAVLWGKRAEPLAKMLVKGSLVYIEGRIQTRSYEDKGGGAKRYSTDINVNELKLLSGGASRDGAGVFGGGQSKPRAGTNDAAGDFGDDFGDSGIPF